MSEIIYEEVLNEYKASVIEFVMKNNELSTKMSKLMLDTIDGSLDFSNINNTIHQMNRMIHNYNVEAQSYLYNIQVEIKQIRDRKKMLM